jgi:hypothetical protein
VPYAQSPSDKEDSEHQDFQNEKYYHNFFLDSLAGTWLHSVSPDDGLEDKRLASL